jgi:hypothetical protein
VVESSASDAHDQAGNHFKGHGRSPNSSHVSAAAGQTDDADDQNTDFQERCKNCGSCPPSDTKVSLAIPPQTRLTLF